MAESKDNFIRLESCPVCTSSQIAPYKTGTFDYCKLEKEQIKITDKEYGKIWDLDRCESCTHVFANPCPSPEFIQSLYAQIEDPLYEEEAKGREKNFTGIFSFLDKFLPQKGLLFDVGAATGILLNLARKKDWKPEGVEPSSWAVQIARDKYNLKILQGSFEQFPMDKNRYAAVTMVDYIEHIPFPQESIQKAYAILAPNGILCLVTPDWNSLFKNSYLSR